MEEIREAFRNAMSDDPKLSSISTSSQGKPSCSSGSSSFSLDQSRVLLTRQPRQVVSLWTCSKLCAICFVAGVVLGYTLKRRVRRWASRLLRRMKDD
ncbi:unnamed protein product [Ilex paraguariensis]|uniref:Transmembrane protein n=1 Tax=Ilex paraguariensis TaxID=185542 RepID=A0ABC8SPX4_9AQUA